MRDLNYYFPKVQEGDGLTLPEIVQFLDYTLSNKTGDIGNMEHFKMLDRNGTITQCKVDRT